MCVGVPEVWGGGLVLAHLLRWCNSSQTTRRPGDRRLTHLNVKSSAETFGGGSVITDRAGRAPHYLAVFDLLYSWSSPQYIAELQAQESIK